MKLPPVIELLDAELKDSSRESILRLISDKSFVEEVRSQAEAAIKGFPYAAEPESMEAGELVISPGGALNPFSGEDKCSELGCRIEAARGFARSIALYADRVVVPDPISGFFLSDRELGTQHAELILSALLVMKKLKPLVDSSIVRFARPSLFLCEECRRAYEDRVRGAEQAMWEEFKQTVRLTVVSSQAESIVLAVQSPLRDSGLTLVLTVKDPPGDVRRILGSLGSNTHLDSEEWGAIQPILAPSLHAAAVGIYRDLAIAGRVRAVYASSSKLSAIGIEALEGKRRADWREWETARRVELPWVSDLEVEELMELRESARDALPRFRERIFRELSGPSVSEEAGTIRAAISLRAEVAELEAELKAAKPRGRSITVMGGAVGLGMIIGGLVLEEGYVVTAGSGLLAALNLFFHKHSESEAREELIKAKPAYVLLVAKDLIKHRPRRP